MGLTSIAAVTSHSTNKITGQTTTETRLYMSSLPPDPARLAAAVRALEAASPLAEAYTVVTIVGKET